MKFLRISTLCALTLSAASGFMLFSTAQKVQQADSAVQHMRSNVAQEEQTIRVLRAEWDYLNRPDRLEALVKNKLEMVPATPDSVRSETADLPNVYTPIIPARKPDYTAPTLKAIPAVAESVSLPKPAAPQSPAAETAPQKNFQTLLNDLSPAGGEQP